MKTLLINISTFVLALAWGTTLSFGLAKYPSQLPLVATMNSNDTFMVSTGLLGHTSTRNITLGQLQSLIGNGTNGAPVSTNFVLQAAAAAAAAATNTLAAAALAGTIPTSVLPNVVLTNGAAGVNLSGAFAGDGANITNQIFPQNVFGLIATSDLLLSASQNATAWSDSPNMAETWAAGDLTNWNYTAGDLQISNNAVYSGNTSVGSAGGATYPFPCPPTQTERAIFNFGWNYNGVSGLGIVGFSSDVTNAAPAAGATRAIGMAFNQVNGWLEGWTNGVFFPLWTNPAAGTTFWSVTATADPFYFSFTAVNVSNSVEYSWQLPRTNFGSMSNLFVFNNSVNTVAGSNIRPSGARLSAATINPPANIEGATRTVVWTGDYSNQFAMRTPTAGYDSRKPGILVLGFHGNGGTANFPASGSEQSFGNTLVNSGFFYLTASGTNNSSWGYSIYEYQKAYQWALTNFPIRAVVLYLVSMGGIEGDNALQQGLFPGCVGLIYKSGTYSLWDNDTNGFGNLITNSYGIAPGTAFYTAVTTHAPEKYSPAVWRGLPIDILTALDDTTVLPFNNSLALAARLAPYQSVTLYTNDLGGHSFTPNLTNQAAVVNDIKRWAQ
jgi:hypothetical protein